MSRNIIILLIMGVITYGFTSPSSSQFNAPTSLNQSSDSLINDSLKKDSLILDSLSADDAMQAALMAANQAIDSMAIGIESTIDSSATTKAIVEPKRTFIYGTASYYHNMFVGRPTSTGDIFKQSKMTCAHRTIPLKSWVRVTRIDNGKSVVLYVNDRMGKSPHEIDLTTTAAKKLGYIHAGWTKVKIEVIPKPKNKTLK